MDSKVTLKLKRKNKSAEDGLNLVLVAYRREV